MARTRLLYLFALFVCLSAALYLGGSAFAANPGKDNTKQAVSGTDQIRQSINYTVYGGGLKALTAQLDIRQAPAGQYQMAMVSETSGLARFLTRWQGTMVTKGGMDQGVAKPDMHEVISIWPDNTQIKRFSYADDGALDKILIIEHGKNTTPSEAPDLGNNTVDLMTAIFQLMGQVTRNGTCDAELTVFDGKRRFLLTGIDGGTEQLKASRYNSFSGPTVRCEIKIVPIAGYWHESLKGWMAFTDYGRESNTFPVIWLGQPKGSPKAVPVKVRAKTKYGTFFVHLTDYQNGKNAKTADLRQN